MANKAVFLDRDDTLIEDPGYISSPEQVKLLDYVSESLIELRRLGYKLIIVSNQSGIARGFLTEKTLGQIHERLEELLLKEGAKLDKIYYCPYHPDGAIPKYRKDSDWRKPKPGMFLAAAKEMDIDLSKSWAVGNSSRDIEAGYNAGCKTILVDDIKHSLKIEPGRRTPDYKAVNMREVVNIIKKHDRNLETVEEDKQLRQEAPVQQPPEIIEPPKVLKPQKELYKKELSEKNSTEVLLREILEQLKKNQRQELFGEFSITRFMAGFVQVVALTCLVISIWLLTSPSRNFESIIISMAFAVFFQLAALTCFIIRSQK
ncbi:MAG: HAD family hydrolase [Phycisphaerae bacterium]